MAPAGYLAVPRGWAAGSIGWFMVSSGRVATASQGWTCAGLKQRCSLAGKLGMPGLGSGRKDGSSLWHSGSTGVAEMFRSSGVRKLYEESLSSAQVCIGPVSSIFDITTFCLLW